MCVRIGIVLRGVVGWKGGRGRKARVRVAEMGDCFTTFAHFWRIGQSHVCEDYTNTLSGKDVSGVINLVALWEFCSLSLL